MPLLLYKAAKTYLQQTVAIALTLVGCQAPEAQHYQEERTQVPILRDSVARNNEPKRRALHPLSDFSLSYAEWETIGCVISIDEAAHWDKYMIGLIQKSGTLRIKHSEKDIILKPRTTKRYKEGLWTNTYANDSIEINVSVFFERKRIMNSLTGFGQIKGNIGNLTFQEDSTFFVARMKK